MIYWIWLTQIPFIGPVTARYLIKELGDAEKIYKEVCKDYEYSQEIKDQADAYGKMEPASAAAILSEMTNDLTLVAKILDSMQTSKSALILQNMKPTTAAQVTTKMTAMKNK